MLFIHGFDWGICRYPSRVIGEKALKFLAWPFGIVLTMRPQREREAARIAADFRIDRYTRHGCAAKARSRRVCGSSPIGSGSFSSALCEALACAPAGGAAAVRTSSRKSATLQPLRRNEPPRTNLAATRDYALSEIVGHFGEGARQVAASQLDSADDHDANERGKRAVLNGRRAGFIGPEPLWHS
jgi:hypothetical protein